MTKEDFVWVGIRIFGIYLLILSLTTMPRLISSGYMAREMSSLSNEVSEKTKVLPDKASPTAQPVEDFVKLGRQFYGRQFVDDALRVVIFTAIGFYLVYGGRFIFRIASRPLKTGGADGSA